MTLVGGGGKHSIFAKVFISLLEENTGVLNTTQLFSELQPKVSKNAKQTPRHGKIRYAHLAPDYLHDAVASLGFSARFQHTENPRRQCSTRMA